MALTQHDLIRIAAENDLEKFIRLVAPHRVLGRIHIELIRWWNKEEAKTHQLALLPRDHQKSALVAYRVAWAITKNPAETIMYLSNTSNLAEKQLKFIKDILTSPIYQRYWPDMVHPDEGKRKKWSQTEIEVDHPLRTKEGVRDPTIFTAGLTTSATGLHFGIVVLDDVVVQENAYTKEGRDKVESQYSLLASIETGEAKEWVVGTRYDPKDLYGQMLEMQAEMYNEAGELESSEPVYEVFQREVEDRGDGTGEFCWPRQQRADGKWFGFNQAILAKKRAQYLDKSQYRAQYYNNPNSSESDNIDRSKFQYYNRSHLNKKDGRWFFRSAPLNIFAAIDFAFSTSKKADYTALVLIGIDPSNNIYILDIDRFRTNKIGDYFDKILEMDNKWDIRKLRAETTVAQESIVEELKLRIRQNGAVISIDSFRPTRGMGTKEERIDAILKPRYEMQTIFHYEGGRCYDLENELADSRPAHDDMKDALANAVAISVAPSKLREFKEDKKIIYNARFGGVAA